MKKFITFLAVSMVCAIGGFTCRAQKNEFVEVQSAVIIRRSESQYNVFTHQYPKNSFDVHVFHSNENTALKHERHYYIVVSENRVMIPDEIGEPFYRKEIKEVELVKWYNAATNEYKYTIRAKKAKNIDLSDLK
jgi:hypothetical protein